MIKLIRMQEVEALTGFKKSYIYKLISLNKFPKQCKLSRASRWSLEEVQQWISEAMEARHAE